MQVRLALPPVPESTVQRLTASLLEIGAVVVEVVDDAEELQIFADFEGRTDAKTIHRSLGSLGLEVDELEVSAGERDLPRYWRRRPPPVRVGPLVVTSAPEDVGSAIGVVIEPGMASGTAHLEGTILCLEALVKRAARDRPRSVLDVGTGTGLLAIAALLLGVDHAVATDIDPHALAVARHNATLNDVDARVVFSSQHPSSFDERFDLVLANLPDATLLPLLPGVLGAVEPGGLAVLIATEEVDCVVEMSASLGGVIEERIERNGWACLVVRIQGASGAQPPHPSCGATPA